MTFLVIQNCNKITTQQRWNRRRTDKFSAAARQSTKVGGGTNKFSAARRGQRTALGSNLCAMRPKIISKTVSRIRRFRVERESLETEKIAHSEQAATMMVGSLFTL